VTDAVRITHIGGPTTLIEVAGWRLLTDPTFDAPGRKYNFGWGSSSTKVTGPAIAAAELGPIDAVLLTHEHHADNLDDAGRALLPSVGVVVTTVSGAKTLGGPARGLAPWTTTTLEAPGRPAIDITATPCRHGPPLSRPIVGEVVGFALRWDGQEHGVLWVSGDTVLYDGVREVARRLQVDAIPCAGSRSARRSTSRCDAPPGRGHRGQADTFASVSGKDVDAGLAAQPRPSGARRNASE
jgi:L-ascorbate metabolism protein UlaG (beta-lactamase superfamily)